MAVQAGSKGSNPTAGAVKTPAPDAVSSPRHPTGLGYGQNNYSGASSIAPGQAVRSPLADNLRTSVSDDALDQVIARGAGNGDEVLNTQVRKIGSGNVAAGHGMHDRNKLSEKVPSSVGWNQGEPARKPTE
jgi:hypothetical protein